MPKIVVIGQSGQLAQALQALRWPAGFELALHGRRSLQENLEAGPLRDLLRAESAQLVLNAAAYTAVDRAESEPQAAAALNAELPRALASACCDAGVPLVHVSTDYVFDGEKRSPYLETDKPHPIGVYGATKLAGDRNLEQSELPRWAILRASWIVSEIGETFPVKILRRARTGAALRVVDDQWGCPTAASDLAIAMQAIGLMLLDGDLRACGLFNFSGASEMSWYGFTEKLLSAAARLGFTSPPLHPIATADLSLPAQRPAYSVLSCDRIRERCSLSGAAIEDHLERMVGRILAL